MIPICTRFPEICDGTYKLTDITNEEVFGTYFPDQQAYEKLLKEPELPLKPMSVGEKVLMCYFSTEQLLISPDRVARGILVDWYDTITTYKFKLFERIG
jgi:hypothetical protein